MAAISKRGRSIITAKSSHLQLHSTKGIVIRVVKYGETSLIVTIFTESFGAQSYMVNGVRAPSKKGPAKANLFQPAALLDLVAYHSDLKNLQRLREFRWSTIYRHIFFDVVKNAVALYMVELLQKCLKQPEPNEDLFNFIEDAFIHLDRGSGRIAANYPLWFCLHLAGFLGFRIQNDQTPRTPVLDLREGLFVPEHPTHHEFLDQPYSGITSQLLQVRMPEELEQLALNQETRRSLLQAYQAFYIFHVPDFGLMKTLPVLQTMLG